MVHRAWQIAALALGMTTIGGVFGTLANRNALAEAERQLVDVRNAKLPPSITEQVIIREPCPYQTLPMADENTECRGGVLLRKTATGWESVMDGNRPARCL